MLPTATNHWTSQLTGWRNLKLCWTNCRAKQTGTTKWCYWLEGTSTAVMWTERRGRSKKTLKKKSVCEEALNIINYIRLTQLQKEPTKQDQVLVCPSNPSLLKSIQTVPGILDHKRIAVTDFYLWAHINMKPPHSITRRLVYYARGIKEILHWAQRDSLDQDYQTELECFKKTHEAADEGTHPQEECWCTLPLALDDLNLEKRTPLFQGQDKSDPLEGVHRVSEKYPTGPEESTLAVHEWNVVRGLKQVTRDPSDIMSGAKDKTTRVYHHIQKNVVPCH